MTSAPSFRGKGAADVGCCINEKAQETVAYLPDLEQAKSAVVNTLSSADAQRGYRHAIDEFIDWYCSEPRLSFNRAVVVRYWMYLEQRS